MNQPGSLFWRSRTKAHQERRFERMRQGKLFFEEMTTQRLDKGKGKDPLVTLGETADWRIFEEPLRSFRESLRTTDSPAGHKPFDPLLVFKVLVLGSLSNLSDDAMEYQIRDRRADQRFCGLSLEDRVGGAKTLWLFRERLTHLPDSSSPFAIWPTTPMASRPGNYVKKGHRAKPWVVFYLN